MERFLIKRGFVVASRLFRFFHELEMILGLNKVLKVAFFIVLIKISSEITCMILIKLYRNVFSSGPLVCSNYGLRFKVSLPQGVT